MVKVGILGNHGKTAAVNFLAQLCKSSGRKVSVLKDIDLSICLHTKEFSFQDYIHALSKSDIEMFIVKISEEGLINNWFSGIDFDVLIYTIGRSEEDYKCKDLYFGERRLFFTLARDAVSIVNADDRSIFKLLKGNKTHLITYGFNSKASITASSIQEEEFNKRVQCCVQRTLTTFSGKELEPQEFSITLPLKNDQELYSALAAITAAMINDVVIPNKILTKKYF
ncbi:Mur ligase family protein [Defluviitalea saccharophila]|uniref:Mur ligase family protein n=1 Tax=Defluviitalea saccharophila TaxID=879970 RepID=A0ABZ2Y5S2_9FIRM|nr:hypothetical protein [Candidatus Epulonipiscium sp.]